MKASRAFQCHCKLKNNSHSTVDTDLSGRLYCPSALKICCGFPSLSPSLSRTRTAAAAILIKCAGKQRGENGLLARISASPVSVPEWLIMFFQQVVLIFVFTYLHVKCMFLIANRLSLVGVVFQLFLQLLSTKASGTSLYQNCPHPDAGCPDPTKHWLPRGFCFSFYLLNAFWPNLTNCTPAFYWLILECLCLVVSVAVLNPDGAPCASLCTSPSLSKCSYQRLHSRNHFLGRNFTDPHEDERLECSDSDGLLYVYASNSQKEKNAQACGCSEMK